MEKKLKSWQGWLLFGGSMVVVFVLGLCVSALMERRAEVASIFNNRKTVIKGIEARNELFKDDFPANIRLGRKRQRLILKASLMAMSLLMLWKNVRKWLFCGQDMHFQKTIPLRADICMLSRILRRHFVPVLLQVRTMALSLLLAGLVRVRMFPA